MDDRDIVYLIDPDSERRAAIADCLDSRRYQIDPARTVAELSRAGTRGGIALVHDGETVVRELTSAIDDDASSTLRVFAFGEAADVPRVVAAVRDGAQYYLVWPFGGTRWPPRSSAPITGTAPPERGNRESCVQTRGSNV